MTRLLFWLFIIACAIALAPYVLWLASVGVAIVLVLVAITILLAWLS